MVMYQNPRVSQFREDTIIIFVPFGGRFGENPSKGPSGTCLKTAPVRRRYDDRKRYDRIYSDNYTARKKLPLESSTLWSLRTKKLSLFFGYERLSKQPRKYGKAWRLFLTKNATRTDGSCRSSPAFKETYILRNIIAR